MRFSEAKNLKVNDFVWVPEARQNARITEIQADSDGKDLFFRLNLDEPEFRSLFHHTAVQPVKTTDEVVEFFLSDSKTKVVINHNNELGQWLYSIQVVDSGGFWLYSFHTQEEAEKYIRAHKLKLA